MEIFAVVKFAGIQYIVFPGAKIVVNKIEEKTDSLIDLKPVLLLVNGEKTEIGTPFVDTQIKAKVLKHFQGDKLEVRKYKSKVRYRRHIGFRSQLTMLEIEEIAGQKKNNIADNTGIKSDIKPKVNKAKNSPPKNIALKQKKSPSKVIEK